MSKEMTFEEKLEALETIVKELESGETNLDDAIDKYTEAMKLAKECNEKLKASTDKVNKILVDNKELQDFNIDEIKD